MVTNLVNARLVMRVGSDRMLWVGSLGAAASGLLVALVAGTGLEGSGVAGALFLFIAMNGFINANMVPARWRACQGASARRLPS